ncbi:MAG: hypothetical protein LBB60_10545 [Desulfovibrio sp.]|jgi:hypothetical protein|nr:hypothetical protein [Desulfovibrio sp.]
MGFSHLSSVDCYCRWYCKEDGDMDDDAIDFMLCRIRYCGFEDALFYDRPRGYLTEITEWRSFVKSGRRLFFCIYKNNGTPIGAAWFESGTQTGKNFIAHFTTLTKPITDEHIKSGRALACLLHEKLGIEQLIGITPACYGHALKVAYAIGYKKVATLRKAVNIHGKMRDAVLSINDLRALEV